MTAGTARGFTLIELMVTITILGILTVLALPGFTRWISSTQVRTLAESFQNGIRLAQREAALRNGVVTFLQTADSDPTCSSTGSSTGKNWVVCAGSSVVQKSVGNAGGSSAKVSASVSSITFNGLGRTGLGAAMTIEVTSTGGACETATAEGIRCLNVLVSQGGKVRLCDPRLDAGDPSACN